MFPATLFDYNGVLADDETVHLEAFRDALAPLGIGVSDRDYVERYLGFDDRGAFRAILEDSGQSPTEVQIAALVEAKKPIYRRRAEAHLPTFAGAAELLERRARAGPVAVVSGALREEILLGLAVLHATALVEHIVSAEDTRSCKPDPEGYLLAIEYLEQRMTKESARRALVIEDSLAGVEAAKAAGLPCVAVAHSYPAPALESSGADLVVSNLGALTDAALAATFRKLYG